jgi:hypothetical protein
VLGLAAFAWLEARTGGGFAQHVLYYNFDPFSITFLIDQWRAVAVYAFLFLSAIGALALLWREDLSTSDQSARPSKTRIILAVVTLWLGFAALITLTAAKIGASRNYFIELLFVCAVSDGMLATFAWQRIVSNRAARNGADIRVLLLVLTIGFSTQFVKDQTYRYPSLDDPELSEIQRSLTREIAQSPQSVLSDDMVLPLRAGREVPIEPLLWTTGSFDQRLFLLQLKNNAFSFVVVKYGFVPEMLAAIVQAYPRKEQLGQYTILRPPKR